jgi:archaetidylinositol phosphate synthase
MVHDPEPAVSHDTVIHRIVRPAVRVAARSGVSPNQITTVRLVSGLAAAVCFAQGGAAWPAIGGVVFVLSMLLDRADGELARQTGQMSKAGHRYDLAADCLASMAAFIGLGIGLVGGHGAVAIWLGVLAGVGIGTLFAELNLLNVASVRGYSLAPGIVVDPDDAMILMPVLIWLGCAWPTTIAAAIITPGAAIVLALLSLRRGG